MQEKCKDYGSVDTVDELVESVMKAYEEYPPHLLDNTFFTLMSVCDSIITVKGSNDYKIKHMGKGRLRHICGGVLPELECSNEALEVLEEVGIPTELGISP